jgi:hypothetical protein
LLADYKHRVEQDELERIAQAQRAKIAIEAAEQAKERAKLEEAEYRKQAARERALINEIENAREV